MAQFVSGQRIVEAAAPTWRTTIPVRQRPLGEVETFASAADVRARRRADDDRGPRPRARPLRRRRARRVQGLAGERRAQELPALRGRRLGGGARLERRAPRGAVARRSRRAERASCSGMPRRCSRPRRRKRFLPAGHAEGWVETFRELYRAVYAAVATGGAAGEPDYPTFADGHSANVLGDAIALSQRRATMGGGDRDEARPADGGVRRDCASRRSPSGRPPTGSRCSRSPAGRPRAASGGATPASPTSTSSSSTRVVCRTSLDRHGLEISSLAYYPNNLHPDPAERRAANNHLRKVIDAAAKLGVPTVGTFVGRDKTKNVPDNFREFRKVWPRARRPRGANAASTSRSRTAR